MKISDALKLEAGKEVKLQGWIHRFRDLKAKKFAVLRDSTGIIQCVLTEGTAMEGKPDVEAFVEVTGVIHEDPRAPGGKEVLAKTFKVIYPSSPDWPFHRYLSVEMQMKYRHLWVRSRKMQAVMKARAVALNAAREWLKSNDFWEVAPPIFVSAACEGGATLFEVNYFGSKAYLSQSAQLYLEALIFSLERVWSLTPSFRAEKSKTRKHLTEYWHLEAEAALVTHEENMKIQEGLLKAMLEAIADTATDEGIEEVYPGTAERCEEMAREEWPKVPYDDIIELLQKKGVAIKWGDDIGADEELVVLNHFQKPVFITRWPLETKVFYMKRDPADEKYVLNDDLLMPNAGEVIGGSQREEDYGKLLENIKFFGLKPEDYSWYLDLRKYGSVPHSGFGIGTERFLMAALGLNHIREALPFPRFINWVWP